MGASSSSWSISSCDRFRPKVCILGADDLRSEVKLEAPFAVVFCPLSPSLAAPIEATRKPGRLVLFSTGGEEFLEPPDEPPGLLDPEDSSSLDPMGGASQTGSFGVDFFCAWAGGFLSDLGSDVNRCP